MSGTTPSPAGPTTHYELFGSLRDARIAYLVTGAVALVLHGVPRLTPDIDLVVGPDPVNVAGLERLLALWGYGEAEPAARTVEGTAVRRFRHPQSALGEIAAVLPEAAAWAGLRARAGAVSLVDLSIPLIDAGDLSALKERDGTEEGREDAAALGVLAAVRAGGQHDDADTRREQIRKFSRWSVAARLDWLLAAARLAKGMSPEAKPMTRGLTRRHGWNGRRDGR